MADRQLSKGEVIGERFVLESPLGKGAFGAVWRATDQANGGATVAVKLLFDKYRQDKKMMGRFLQEAKITTRLQHPGIARSIAWDGEGPDAYMAMEFIEGETLDQKFEGNSKDNSPIPKEGIAWIADQLCAAIGYAHQENVVHRDLKPRNVMVNKRGARPFVKVLDFGIAKILVGSEIDPTTVGRVLGSVLYISPEQILGKPIDHRADIFALGSILYELITLRRAWARDDHGRPHPFHKPITVGEYNSHVAVLRRISREPRPKASTERSDVSPAVDVVLAKAMAIKAEDRYGSAEEFAKALRGALLDLGAAEVGGGAEASEDQTLTVPPVASPVAPQRSAPPKIEVRPMPPPRAESPAPAELAGPGPQGTPTEKMERVAPTPMIPPAPMVHPPAPASARGEGRWLAGVLFASALLLLGLAAYFGLTR